MTTPDLATVLAQAIPADVDSRPPGYPAAVWAAGQRRRRTRMIGITVAGVLTASGVGAVVNQMVVRPQPTVAATTTDRAATAAQMSLEQIKSEVGAALAAMAPNVPNNALSLDASTGTVQLHYTPTDNQMFMNLIADRTKLYAGRFVAVADGGPELPALQATPGVTPTAPPGSAP